VVARPIEAVGHSLPVADGELALQRVGNVGTLGESDHSGAGLVIPAFGVVAVFLELVNVNVHAAIAEVS